MQFESGNVAPDVYSSKPFPVVNAWSHFITCIVNLSEHSTLVIAPSSYFDIFKYNPLPFELILIFPVACVIVPFNKNELASNLISPD
nr:MAG TPA: hypothetical protein [Caudoviricetes sp.]